MKMPVKSRANPIEFNLKNAFALALRLLGRKERSEAQLVAALAERGVPDELIPEVIDRCIMDGWLSNMRYGEAVVRSSVTQCYGPRRISHYLRQQGLDAIEIEQILNEADVDWAELAATWLKNKAKGLYLHDFEAKATWHRRLTQRGFTATQCQEAFRIYQRKYETLG